MTIAVAIKTNGSVDLIDLPNTNAHETIHEAVGGWFDAVRIRERGVVMYVHDEGILLGMEPNVVASILAGGLICGDAVLVGIYNKNGNEDGNDYNVPSEFLTADFAAGVEFANTREETLEKLRAIRDESDWTPVVTSF